MKKQQNTSPEQFSQKDKNCTQFEALNPVQICVKCPTYFKDSASLDIIQSYSSGQTQKVLIVCTSIQQAQILHKSDYLKNISTLIHNGLDRRQRIKKGKLFQMSNQKKCLITNHINSTQLKKLQVKLIIFASPPRNYYVYKQVFQFCKNAQVVVIFYCTKQISQICRLENELQYKFHPIQPPQVSSSQQDQPLKRQSIQIKQQPKKLLKKQTTQMKDVKQNQQQKFKLVFKNLDYEVGWQDFKNFLSERNIQTIDIKVIAVNRPNAILERRKTGFVTCKDNISYNKALKLFGTNYFNRKISVFPYNQSKKQKQAQTN